MLEMYIVTFVCFRCHAQWKNYKIPEEKLAVEISGRNCYNILLIRIDFL